MPLAFYYIFANGYLTEVGMKNATGWMTLGQFSEIFFMLALPFFTKRFGIKKVLLLGLVTAAIRYGFFIYGSADEYFTYALLFLGILLHGVSYDFYYVTAYIYVDKKAPVHMRTAAQGLITLCCQGFGSLLGYRLGGVMMEKMFAYQEPVNGLTFNWSGKLNENRTYSRCSLWAGVRGCNGDALRALAAQSRQSTLWLD